MTQTSKPSPNGHASSACKNSDRYAQICAWLVDRLADELQIDACDVDPLAPLTSYGLGSMQAVVLSGDLEDWLDISVSPTLAYEHPTVDAIARLLAATNGATNGNGAAAPASVDTRANRHPVRDECPRVSLGQQRLWILQQLEPKDVSYNEAVWIELEGSLDTVALQGAIADVVRRHDVLRSSFFDEAGEVRQRVSSEAMPEFVSVDLSSMPEIQARSAANATARQLARRPFDLGLAPLARLAVVRLAPQKHGLLLIVHHMICDGSSLDILSRQLSASYNARRRRQPVTCSDATTSGYADFASSQREQLLQGQLETQSRYWEHQFASPVSAIEFSMGRHESAAGNSTNGGLVSFELSESLRTSVDEISRREGVTVFMTLLAAFKVLLWRYSGQTDLVVGTTVAGRQRPEYRDLIGFFVNTLPVRTDLGRDPRFVDLLGRVRTTCLGAYANQEYPFDQIARKMRTGNSSGSQLPNVAFTFLNAGTRLNMDGLRETNRETVHTGTSKFDLSLIIQEVGGGFHGLIEFRDDTFTAAEIGRLTQHLTALLEEVAADPEKRISAFDLLTESESQIVRPNRENTVATQPTGCMHELFAAQAGRTPDAVAIIFDDQQMSYADLDSRSSALAVELRRRGIGPESFVPLCMERSIELVVGMLGVLKAGGAYVPVDPALPPNRIQQIVNDSAAEVMLTTSHHEPLLCADALCLDLWQADAKSRVAEVAPSIVVDLDNPAYAIFTSGSTGTPKGVVVSHRAICNHMHWMQKAYPLSPDDAVLQKTPIGFDASVWEFYAPLFVGGCLVMARPDGHQDPEYLWRTIEEHGISVLQVVPSLLRLLWDSRANKSRPSLNRIFCGGEALPASLVRRVMTSSGAQVINLYGPTETTIDASHYLCTAPRSDDSKVSIGRPIDNIWMTVVDALGCVTPIGVGGELVIGGAGLARGYLAKPDLTATQFVPDSHSGIVGGRLYRSGDLAAITPDGCFEYRGRIDHQVKLRGHRIELGEIELCLSNHPKIKSAVADVRRSETSETLVAYVVAEAKGEIPNTSELRAYLSKQLPDYMIPAVYVPLAQLPLSHHGKLDRKALPDPTQNERPELASQFSEAQTRNEQLLVEIWEAVLGIEGVGIDDSFFDLGGDSILSLQVVSKASQAGLSLSLKQLMQEPTIRDLAAQVRDTPNILAEQGPVVGISPVTPIQSWFFEQNFDRPEHWNQSLLLNFHEPVDLDALRQALKCLVAHHDVLRSHFEQVVGPNDQPLWTQVQTSDSNSFELMNVDLTGKTVQKQDEELDAIARREQSSLDLQQGRVFRGLLVNCGDGGSKLLLVAHHLLVDGVSWRILLEHLHLAYSQARAKSEIALPPKSTAYQQWAARLAEYANTDDVATCGASWLPPTEVLSELPVDLESHENTEGSVRKVLVSLDAEATESLLRDVPAAYHTEVNDVLLTAMSYTLSNWMQTDAVWVHLEGHGREDLFDDFDLTRTVGWFTTLFPVLLKSEQGSTWGDSIKSTKSQLGQVPGRGISYGLLRYLRSVQECDFGSRLKTLPKPAISFNYLGQIDHTLSPDGAFELERMALGSERAESNRRPHLLDVVCVIRQGQLEFEWSYSVNRHHESTIEQLATGCLQTLRELIEHCVSTDELAYATDDFAEFDWDENEFADIVAEIDRSTSA